MDDLLPWPTPQWGDPGPCDAPTPEEVDTFAVLRATAGRLPLWLAFAATNGVTPKDWWQLAETLREVARLCAERADSGLAGQSGDEQALRADQRL